MSDLTRQSIFALSSGRPPAAIAVVRISGPQARAALLALIGRIPEPRLATLAQVREPSSGEAIDEALILFFPGPRSETGEDTAEIHLHGGRAVIAATLAALARIPGCRMAEPGEFTRRAFEHGRIDLTRVEGLADLIAAETQTQRRQAFGQMRGVLGMRAEEWRKSLIAALALVEAGIDFSDEADVPAELTGPALSSARRLIDEIEAVLDDNRRGERLREGLVVAIAGPPNAGKSSLLNRIARRDAAIVSPIAGTTRDAIEVHLDLGSLPVTFVDTAGIRDSDDPVEQEGVRRAKARAQRADLILWIVDSSLQAPLTIPEDLNGEAEAAIWLVRNKIDLAVASGGTTADCGRGKTLERSLAVSALEGSGIDALVSAVEAFAADAMDLTEPALVTRERHRVALSQTVAALRRAVAEGAAGRQEIVAEELRLAARALGRLTGRVDVEDILDAIFRDFCIGK